MSVSILTNSSPLTVGSSYLSPWLTVDPTYPFINITASSDQAGSLAVYESDQSDGTVTLVASLQVYAGAAPNQLQASLRAPFVRVVYTNGSVSQTAFAIAITTSTVPIDSTQSRKLDMMLRELRAHTMILLSLKEPSGATPNIPMGLADLTQGTSIPALVSAPPTPYTPPSFD